MEDGGDVPCRGVPWAERFLLGVMGVVTLEYPIALRIGLVFIFDWDDIADDSTV